ncbi:helix-turn-helix transcriptional regulator [Salmonella enterica]|nr:helix-turn-helix transcriptional regulator [Salmonella enterica]EFS3370494.1 helix-turn-helix transcriptional regulator [Salmonella enterica]EGS4024356.1 helix-turn-helix transcriptional regulator [Salmonella enterica]EHT4473675.1 helix-turn-helix transcriptional regulator [Salmonella enterica]EKM9605740.1 helix-turn-helix transcriptional regulator [Salmonella enterica]
MNGLTIISDNSYTQIAIANLATQFSSRCCMEGKLAIFTFEKNWLSCNEFQFILNCRANRVLILMKKCSLLYIAEMPVSDRFYFVDYEASVVSLTKILAQFFLEKKTQRFFGLNHSRKINITITKREHQIILLYANGFAIKQIADALALNIKTVYSHKLKAMTKMNISNNAELVRRKWEVLFIYQLNLLIDGCIFPAASFLNANVVPLKDARTKATIFAGGYLQNVKHSAPAKQLFNDNLNKLNSVSLERPSIDRECASLNKLTHHSN